MVSLSWSVVEFLCQELTALHIYAIVADWKDVQIVNEPSVVYINLKWYMSVIPSRCFWMVLIALSN